MGVPTLVQYSTYWLKETIFGKNSGENFGDSSKIVVLEIYENTAKICRFGDYRNSCEVNLFALQNKIDHERKIN
jgi:hypothetical protein